MSVDVAGPRSGSPSKYIPTPRTYITTKLSNTESLHSTYRCDERIEENP